MNVYGKKGVTVFTGILMEDTVVLMHSNKDIKRGLLKGILDEIQISREEFFRRFK